LHSIDQEGRLICVNNYWLEVMGYTREDVIGRYVSDFMTADSRVFAKQQALPELMRRGFCEDIPYQFVKRNGEVIDVLISATLEHDEEGNRFRSLAVVVDITERKRLEAELIRLARVDHLTGIWNRGYFMELLNGEVKRAHRHRKRLSVLLCDIDYFKRINDRYGHQAGDTALRRFAETAGTLLRTSDHLGRWGGEEFALALPETRLSGAHQTAERLRQQIEEMPVIHEGRHFSLTLSVGVCVLRKEDTVESIIARADRALYKAKETGRNRVVVDSD
jgi:diguanylate cyclase (GGDEF)-like protein/PAS domain S-box-containing protein